MVAPEEGVVRVGTDSPHLAGELARREVPGEQARRLNGVGKSHLFRIPALIRPHKKKSPGRERPGLGKGPSYFLTSNSASMTSSLPLPSPPGWLPPPPPPPAARRWTCWAMAWAAECRSLTAWRMALTSLWPTASLTRLTAALIGALSDSDRPSPCSLSSFST